MQFEVLVHQCICKFQREVGELYRCSHFLQRKDVLRDVFSNGGDRTVASQELVSQGGHSPFTL